jgi:hypothetical protein
MRASNPLLNDPDVTYARATALNSSSHLVPMLPVAVLIRDLKDPSLNQLAGDRKILLASENGSKLGRYLEDGQFAFRTDMIIGNCLLTLCSRKLFKNSSGAASSLSLGAPQTMEHLSAPIQARGKHASPMDAC